MNPIKNLIQLYRTLHQHPERSGNEQKTAQIIFRFFAELNPDRSIENLGGHGLAFIFEGHKPGPTLLLRCELDAVPVSEENNISYRSKYEGISHACGHDGHMAILAAVGKKLSEERPQKGRVVLLYQPAEETGEGAAAVIADPKLGSIRPDFVFALHNLPGYAVGQIIVRSGTFNSASRGICIKLTGATAHAAQPETGRSPAIAMNQIMQQLSTLQDCIVPDSECAFITLVGARLGEKAFGTAPGQAEIWATLRSESDETMSHMVKHVETITKQAASSEQLDCRITYEDIFEATVNSRQAVDIIRRAAKNSHVEEMGKPFRWSEDFGRFTQLAQGALFGIGTGIDVPELHNPDFNFPETLIEKGRDIYMGIIRECMNT